MTTTQKKTKKPSTSRQELTAKQNDPKYKRNITMSNGETLKVTASQYGSIRSSKGKGIHQLPKEKLSTERPREILEVTDNFDSLKYPPPSRDPEFRKIWADGIKGLVSRSNFIPAHLGLFETYCSVLLELRQLDEFIAQNGMVYRIMTMTGEIRRPQPEVALRKQAQGQLAAYARLLGIQPTKAKAGDHGSGHEDEEEEWGK